MKKMVLLIVFLLSACTNASRTIFILPEGNVELRDVLVSQDDSLDGTRVRWGGEILSVKQENGLSVIELKHFPLMRNGFPLSNLPSQGQFIAQSSQLLDSQVYLEGLLVTFAATVTTETTPYFDRIDRVMPHIDIVDAELWPHNSSHVKPYTYTGTESVFKGYGIYGSGYYTLY